VSHACRSNLLHQPAIARNFQPPKLSTRLELCQSRHARGQLLQLVSADGKEDEAAQGCQRTPCSEGHPHVAIEGVVKVQQAQASQRRHLRGIWRKQEGSDTCAGDGKAGSSSQAPQEINVSKGGKAGL
jgi:hypothetical protein